MAKIPSGYADIIRKNHENTQAFVVATQPPCVAHRNRIAKEIRRKIQVVEAGDTQNLAIPTSWSLGYFLCPGEDLSWFVQWAKRLSAAQRARITFYHNLPDDELATAFAPWAEAGLGRFYEWRVNGWAQLANQFVVDLNTQIIVDAGYEVDTQR